MKFAFMYIKLHFKCTVENKCLVLETQILDQKLSKNPKKMNKTILK